MNFDTLDSVRAAGFTGFLPPPELRHSRGSSLNVDVRFAQYQENRVYFTWIFLPWSMPGKTYA